MHGFALTKGMAFDWDGVSFRIDRMQPNGDVVLERIRDGHVVLATCDHLLSEYVQGRVSRTRPHVIASSSRTPPIYSRPLVELPARVQTETTRRWLYVQALLDSEGIVFTTTVMRPFIAEVAAKIGDAHPPSVTTLYRWYSRYRLHQDTRALVPRTDRRGCRNLKQDADILRLVSEAVEEAFASSPLATVQNVYARLAVKIEIENRQRVAAQQLKRPALRTVYRLFARVDAFERIELRTGTAAANKRLRLVRTGVTTENILERAEIDHTPLDLFVIDEKTWLPLGRPTLTVILDHFSRMPLGYHLCFGAPSTVAVMGALRHAILPKEQVAQVLPNLEIEHRWPCYGRPDVLVADNGLEFHGKDLEGVCFDLDIRIQYCPKHQPRFKGVVERYLKTINYFFAHQLPGTSFAKMHLRGEYDPQKHALLTLAEFKQVFEKWLIDVYAQQVHRTLGMTPWAKWQDGASRRTPTLPADLRDLRRRIGLVDERALRRDGIWLNGIRYSGDGLQPILNAYGEGVRVRVLSDPEDLGEIDVWAPQEQMPVTVLAIDQSYARGLTLHQNELIRARQREFGATTEDRAALERAKHELINAVQSLMSSRKQRDRRKAAMIRGISSSKPSAEISIPSLATKALDTAPRIAPEKTKDDLPVARYVSFRVKR
ncbi:Mu transposase C-terminal domain-containing protein [Paraburkholderia sp. BR14320]|uniref:Mu transposase C-terminal domain-containing protein n=1 Tax=unclassified Paraburkholderia TaxID=2615204 RepID=UPI0034D016FB